MRSTVTGGSSAGVPSPSNEPAFRPAGPGEAPAAPGAEPPLPGETMLPVWEAVRRASHATALLELATDPNDRNRLAGELVERLELALRESFYLARGLGVVPPSHDVTAPAVAALRLNIREAVGIKAVVVKAYLARTIRSSTVRSFSYTQCKDVVDELASLLATVEGRP